ncbi:hypothetical protein V8E36_001484 [Tilletia maclaganii]
MATAPTFPPTAALLRPDRGDRRRLSRRRERNEDEHGEDADGSQDVGPRTTIHGQRIDGTVGLGDGDRSFEGSDKRQELEPARKRRKKRPSTGTGAQERMSLLGHSITPGPWVVTDRVSPSVSHRKTARLPAVREDHSGAQLSTGLVDTAAMEAEGVDRQFADMLSEYLQLDATMEDASHSSRAVVSSRAAQDLNTSSDPSTSSPHRAPKERIIPGFRPRSAAQNPMMSSPLPTNLQAYRDKTGQSSALNDAASDHSSDWQDEKDEKAAESDDSSALDPDRAGEDEDSNSEGFYRNDYPEGEGRENDEGETFWDSEEERGEGEDDDDGIASDQYEGED